MRVFLLLILILGLTVFANAQVCGYTFLTIYLNDSDGNLIKNAEIKTFDKDFKEKDNLHYPSKNEENYDSMANQIAWSEKKTGLFWF